MHSNSTAHVVILAYTEVTVRVILMHHFHNHFGMCRYMIMWQITMFLVSSLATARPADASSLCCEQLNQSAVSHQWVSHTCPCLVPSAALGLRVLSCSLLSWSAALRALVGSQQLMLLKSSSLLCVQLMMCCPGGYTHTPSAKQTAVTSVQSVLCLGCGDYLHCLLMHSGKGNKSSSSSRH